MLKAWGEILIYFILILFGASATLIFIVDPQSNFPFFILLHEIIILQLIRK